MILLLSLPNVIFFLLKLSATVLQDLQFLWLLEYKSRILFKKNKTSQLNIVILCLAFTFIILMNVMPQALNTFTERMNDLSVIVAWEMSNNYPQVTNHNGKAHYQVIVRVKG